MDKMLVGNENRCSALLRNSGNLFLPKFGGPPLKMSPPVTSYTWSHPAWFAILIRCYYA